jgi:hypothetical protein
MRWSASDDRTNSYHNNPAIVDSLQAFSTLIGGIHMSTVNTTTRRRLLTTGLAGATAIAATGLPAGAAETADPVFAAIEAHRVALAEVERQESGLGLPDATDEAYADEGEAITDLVRTTPTTVAGCAALLRHLQEYTDADLGSAPFADYQNDLGEAGETLFGRLATVLAGTREAQS